MKKFMKAFAVLSAMAMLAGSFVSCSSDDDSSDPKPAATEYTCTNCGTKYTTEAAKDNCATKAGCPKYEAGTTTYTCTNCGTAYDTEAEKDNCDKQAGCPKYVAPEFSSYTSDFAKIATKAGITPSTSNDGKVNVESPLNEVAYFDDATFYFMNASKAKGGLTFRTVNADNKTYALCYSKSSFTVADDINDAEGAKTLNGKAVGDTVTFKYDSEKETGAGADYCQQFIGLNLANAGAAATDDVEVSFEFKVVANSACSDDSGIVCLIDETGKVLAVETGLKLKSATSDAPDVRTIKATVKGDKQVIILFSRNGCQKPDSSNANKSAGGINVLSIKAEKAAN